MIFSEKEKPFLISKISSLLFNFKGNSCSLVYLLSASITTSLIMASFCNLPRNILGRIMLLVPPDSVLQFKFVNKFCYSLISGLINDPKFVSKHLFITKNQSSASLLFKRPFIHVDDHLIKYPLLTIIYDDDDDDDDDDDVKLFYSVVPVPGSISLPLIHDERCNDENQWNRFYHCDGLILQVNPLGRMMLCNPCLKESMILPQPRNTTIKGPYTNIGFEFDSKTNDYKCVAIWFDDEDYAFEVYTVGSDSWREINMSQDVIVGIMGAKLQDGLCWSGVCYWFVVFDDTYENVLTFNMSNEEFDLIRDLPVGELLVSDDRPHLSVWNDSLVLCWRDTDNNLCISTMDGTKNVQLPTLDCHFRVLPFSKNDDFLIKFWRDYGTQTQFVSCNFLRGISMIFYDLARNLAAFFECFYVKTLVSIKRRGEVD
ncbi:hypothetical protein G4B88_030871 [Cannabis sativa]|uniref:F-box domain-containing protein n=1 Tax=Cannabis sativa TaxID=3483 RepID=A0A7J6DW52_CANSA|nr:hypothetical protein G4B88_030871 [Cannabis sativa]